MQGANTATLLDFTFSVNATKGQTSVPSNHVSIYTLTQKKRTKKHEATHPCSILAETTSWVEKGSTRKADCSGSLDRACFLNNFNTLHWYFIKAFTDTRKSQKSRHTATAHLWYATNWSQGFPTKTIRCQLFKILRRANFWGVVFNGHNWNISDLDSTAIVSYFYFVKPIILLKKKKKRNLSQTNELRHQKPVKNTASLF